MTIERCKQIIEYLKKAKNSSQDVTLDIMIEGEILPSHVSIDIINKSTRKNVIKDILKDYKLLLRGLEAHERNLIIAERMVNASVNIDSDK